jgi:hypothetical protein
MLSSSFLPDHILLHQVNTIGYETRGGCSDRTSFSGVFVIGLIVPSNAPVLREGGISASPFVYGQSMSNHNKTFETNVVPSSCSRTPDPGFESCHQCLNAHFYRLIGEHGLVYCVANTLWIRTPAASPKNLQKGDEARSSCLGVAFLLALQPPRLYEFRTTRWCHNYSLLHIRPLTSSNSFHLFGQRVSNIWRNYLE